jgi:hypothetical protein
MKRPGKKPKRVKSLSVRGVAARSSKSVTGGADPVRPLVRPQVKNLLTKSQ